MKTLFVALNPQIYKHGIKNNCLRLYLIHDRFEEVAWSNPTETDKKAALKKDRKTHKGTKQTRNEKWKVELLISSGIELQSLLAQTTFVLSNQREREREREIRSQEDY